MLVGWGLEAIASRLEAIASKVEAIASRLEAIAITLEAISIRLEAIAIRFEAIASRLEAIVCEVFSQTIRRLITPLRPLLYGLLSPGSGDLGCATAGRSAHLGATTDAAGDCMEH